MTCAVIAICLIAVVCFVGAIMWPSLFPHVTDIAEVAEVCRLQFPDGTRLLSSHTSVMGRLFYAKLTMDKADVRSFISALPQGSEVSRTKRIDGLPSADMAWWNPGSPSRFVSIFARPDYVPAVRILISLDDREHAVMYLYQTH